MAQNRAAKVAKINLAFFSGQCLNDHVNFLDDAIKFAHIVSDSGVNTFKTGISL